MDSTSANAALPEGLEQMLATHDIEFDENDQHFKYLAHGTNLGMQCILETLGTNIFYLKLLSPGWMNVFFEKFWFRNQSC